MKRNKTFVTAMIITSIIGFTALLIIMFIGIKYFVKETIPPAQNESPSMSQESQESYITSIGVVKEISSEQIRFLDVKKKELISHKIKPTTKILDKDENTLPLLEIKVGEIVDIVYQPEKENLVCIRRTAKAFKKTNVTNLEIDRPNKTISIGKKMYYYTDQILVFNEENQMTNTYSISNQDILELTGVEDYIYAVKVVEREGYLKLNGLPSYEGMLEIDMNRQIPLNENMQVTALSPGEHKVTIRLDQYEPISTTVTIEPKKTLEFTPEHFERLQTELTIQVVNTSDYKVQIEDTTYNPGDPIKVPTGNYTIEIKAQGFKNWKQEMSLQKPAILLQVTLASESEGEEGVGQLEEVTTSADGDSSDSSSTDYSTNISSEPSDAKVYINGTSKGTTPYKTTLPVGEYNIILKKEGYKDYETNILIDHSDDQNSYLYMLIPE